MLKAILIAMSVGLSMTAPPPAAGSEGFERLEGFESIVLNQVNQVMGSDRLPSGMGLPVEPGVYVVIASDRLTIFDKAVAGVEGGQRYANADQIAPESKTGCPISVFDGFYSTWSRIVDEARVAALDVPNRVLIGADASLPASMFLQAAYAAMETRPMSVPNLYMLVNGGRAGLRARPFFVLPPEGLLVPSGQRPLALRVTMKGGDRFSVSAASPKFGRVVEATSSSELFSILQDVKKRNPGKETLIIDASEGGTVGDMLKVIALAQDEFSRVVLALGQKVVIG
ncbi:MAG: hypothetical protein ACPHRO_11600 [Nannocystaceae bacterium]